MAKEETSNQKKPIEVLPPAVPGTLDREGLVNGTVSLTAEVSERTARSVFSIAREARTEVVDRLLASIDWRDDTQQGLLRLARRITESGGAIATDVLEAGEQLSVGTVRIARETSRGVTELVQRVLVADAARPTQPRASA